TYKEALTQSCWIEAMQEELNEFERLEVWELIPRPDQVMAITLKWIYKVKLDELGGILKNKARWLPEVTVKKRGSTLKTRLLWHLYQSKYALESLKNYGFKSCDPVDTLMVEKSKLDEDKEGKAIDPSRLKISQSPRGIFINQSKYALESLKNYGFESCDPVDTPMVEKSKLDEDKEGKAVDPSHYRGMIGTLLYLTASRPDLQFAISMCARYQARPTEKNDSSVALTSFANVDHAGCQDTRRSTSGSVQFLGERLISLPSKRQKSAAISSMEAEYIALSGCCAQVLWMRSQLLDYGLGFNIIPIYHFIKEKAENWVIELYFVNTEYQLADLFTKSIGRERIEFLINKLGMRSFTPETLKQLMNEEDE
nr:retrovirus-related Pol polyprotein from transposon TNT 1-94 [Tanacetum cinerariifolium]